MRKLSWGTVLLIFAVSSANAADMPLKTPTYALAPLYNWSGFYVGGTAGGPLGSFDPSTATVFSPVGYLAAANIFTQLRS